MLVNNFCRNAISSKNAHFCWMMGRCYPFVETWGSIISKQSNVNQDHSVHEGLYVKVCWGCLKVMLSSALLASFFNENSTPFIPSKFVTNYGENISLALNVLPCFKERLQLLNIRWSPQQLLPCIHLAVLLSWYSIVRLPFQCHTVYQWRMLELFL